MNFYNISVTDKTILTHLKRSGGYYTPDAYQYSFNKIKNDENNKQVEVIIKFRGQEVDRYIALIPVEMYLDEFFVSSFGNRIYEELSINTNSPIINSQPSNNMSNDSKNKA